MLSDALSFPRSGDDWLPTLVIGALLIPLSVLVIPAFILQGYFARVIRAAATNDSTAPSFTDWGDLLVTGLKMAVIGFAYSLVINVPSFGLQFLVAFGANESSVGVLLVVMLLVVLALSLVVAFFAPAALVNFAIEDSFGAAFDFGTIWSGVATSEYVVAWLLAMVVGVVGFLVGAVFSVVLVGFLVLFYVQIATYYLLARGFVKGLGRTPGESATTTTL
ncbi:DUF4013 domain-containing protein [Halogranum rubrum]|uniref:DUF4013 domain-containing protein n=1 Tax=Halogranum salarium B-1 TaxID=1210908 RepID=J3JF26_9EURY|nr:DUF4013 domain-containing protein [Halogranum salarium]EJN58889.1 hypothetical protein HSB1_23100 [Halogranum salarium B-1]